MDETKFIVEKYSAIRTECSDVICAVIPAENLHTDTSQPQPHQRHTIKLCGLEFTIEWLCVRM